MNKSARGAAAQCIRGMLDAAIIDKDVCSIAFVIIRRDDIAYWDDNLDQVARRKHVRTEQRQFEFIEGE